MEYFENNIEDQKKRRISLMVEYLAKASLNEQKYFAECIEEHMRVGQRRPELESDFPSSMSEFEGVWPPENKNWFQQFGVFSGGQGSADSGNDQAKSNEGTEEVVEEKVAEKTIYELVINSFDAKQKIKIIKEVKNTLGYGLKESKELVEKTPTVLKNQ